MPIIVELPDTLESLLVVEGGDPARAVLEAIVLEGYRSGRVSERDIQGFLGLPTSSHVHQFLTKHGIALPHSEEVCEKAMEPVPQNLTVAERRKLEGRKSLPELFAESPLKGLDLDFSRNRSGGRQVDL